MISIKIYNGQSAGQDFVALECHKPGIVGRKVVLAKSKDVALRERFVGVRDILDRQRAVSASLAVARPSDLPLHVRDPQPGVSDFPRVVAPDLGTVGADVRYPGGPSQPGGRFVARTGQRFLDTAR